MYSERLRKAIALVKRGKYDTARPILINILKHQPRQETAWMYLARTLPTYEERIQALEHCLRFNPDSQLAQKGLASLKAQKEKAKQSLPLAQEQVPEPFQEPPGVQPASEVEKAVPVSEAAQAVEREGKSTPAVSPIAPRRRPWRPIEIFIIIVLIVLFIVVTGLAVWTFVL